MLFSPNISTKGVSKNYQISETLLNNTHISLILQEKGVGLFYGFVFVSDQQPPQFLKCMRTAETAQGSEGKDTCLQPDNPICFLGPTKVREN